MGCSLPSHRLALSAHDSAHNKAPPAHKVAYGLAHVLEKGTQVGARDERRSTRIDGTQPGTDPPSNCVLVFSKKPSSLFDRIRAVNLNDTWVSIPAHKSVDHSSELRQRPTSAEVVLRVN